MTDEAPTPEEGDAYISDHRWGYSVSWDGKARGYVPDMDEAIAHLIAEFTRSQFYPNVWYVNDHGNATLLEVNPETGT